MSQEAPPVRKNARGSITELEPIVKSEADVQETDF